MNKYCPICNKIFSKKRKKYCSEYCSKIAEDNSKKLWAINNKEKILLSAKKYRDSHKKERKILEDKYRKTHRKQACEKVKRYYWRNREKICQKARIYRLKHKEQRKIYDRIYRNKRKKIDINFKLLTYLRSNLWKYLKSNYKYGSSIQLIGCSIDQLKQHIEKQFKPGMSWSNHGKGDNGKGMKEWHIDHIVPCASFDLSIPEEQHKCFHYTNLQPLWAIENAKKAAHL
jgi:hypothetical protein